MGDPERLEESSGGLDQVYDIAMRRLAEPNLPTLAGWLDPTLLGLPSGSFSQRPTALSMPTLHADLVTTAGGNRLMHVEYETHPKKGLVTRMLNYRARLMAVMPDVQLTQHVIVLGSGTVTGHKDPGRGFTLELQVVYLRNRDAAEFLRDPVLAPLAVLARGRRQNREKAFGAALRLLRDSGHPRADELIQVAETLALIRLNLATITRIREENNMDIQPWVDHYARTDMGQRIQRMGNEKGHAQERREMLLALLNTRFGDSAEGPEVAGRLSAWPRAAALEAIFAASDVSSLLALESPA